MVHCAAHYQAPQIMRIHSQGIGGDKSLTLDEIWTEIDFISETFSSYKSVL